MPWRYFEKKTYESYNNGSVSFFEVVMVSKLSNDVKKYLLKSKRPSE